MSQRPAFGASPEGRFFIKMQGLHNHFVIVDGRVERYQPSTADTVQVCNPRTGVGGDQLVILEKPTAQGTAAGASTFVKILNVDGREVEACGNATRCVAWLLLEEAGAEQVTLETLAGLIDCRRAGPLQVSCTMGKVSSTWQDVPLAEPRDTLNLDLGIAGLGPAVALNIGNPHVIFFVDDIAAIDVETVAPVIQNNPLFPDQVNVGFARMQTVEYMDLVVYERGAGLTTACGSGACVAVYAARLRGLTTLSALTVAMPAGEMDIAIEDDNRAVMTGPVGYCFSGYLQ